MWQTNTTSKWFDHMAHDYKKLDDNEIVKLVDDNVRTSTGYTSSDLAKEREKVLQYYNAKLPKPATASHQLQEPLRWNFAPSSGTSARIDPPNHSPR